VNHNLDAGDLLSAVQTVTLTFDGLPAGPVALDDPANLTPAQAIHVLERYRRHGFAIVQAPMRGLGRQTLLDLADSLDLGEPYLPPLYTLTGGQTPTIAQISAAHNAGTKDEQHPSFGRTDGQRLHSDGTLQDIGVVKATVLLCEAPAAEGGDTILFNSSAAFRDLAQTDLAAASALATPGTLVRTANINGSTDANAGPVFAVHDGTIIGRYSVTDTDAWAEPAGVVATDLRRGIEFLATASQTDSRYFHQLRLAGGQAIVFDNTRISHGRTSYVDSAEHRRCMYRSLHLRHPRLRPELSGNPEVAQ
jgi:hypothetical protein